MNRLETEYLGIKFKNPIIGASGTYGYGTDYKDYYPIDLIGGISSKGLTYIPKEGNRGIRLWETPSGLMNSIGLENPGIENFIKEGMASIISLGPKVLINLGGNSIDDYVRGAELLNESRIDLIELNISCPNVKEGGMVFGVDPQSAAEVTRKVKKVSKHKIVVKLSPNARDISEIAKAVEEAGADGISLVNTFLAMAIDIKNKRPVFENTYAGLSGPAIKPIALRMVHQAAHAVKIPVIGMGGITNYKDVIEFIMAGAKLVQIGTYNFMNPYGVKEIIEDLDDYCKRENINLSDLYKIL